MIKIGACKKVLTRLDDRTSEFFRSGFAVLARADFADCLAHVYPAAKAKIGVVEAAASSAWLSWAREAFQRGASQAHRFSKVRAVQEVVAA
eukprot:7049168-Pyramimonas_sp.AAC.1